MNRKSLLIISVCAAMAMSMTACGNGQAGKEPVEQLTQTTELADYSSYVTLGQYTDLSIPVSDAVVSQKMLQEAMDHTVETYNYLYAQTEMIGDRPVAMGDTINMNFTTTVDGENWPQLSGMGLTYVVGSGQIEESLDAQMAGLKPGNTYDLDCTFGEDTDFTELLGKEVTFHVTINYIYGESETLEWGDELVAALTNGKYKDAEKYKDYLFKQLEEEALEQQKKEYMDGLWDAVLANCVFGELPADILEENAENYYAAQRATYEYYATYYSYTYDQYMQEKQGMTDEEFHEKAYEYARIELERIYAAVTIYRELGMEMTDAEFSEGVAKLAETYNYGSSTEFVQKYGEEYIREVLVTQKVEEYLAEHSTMTVGG